MLFLLALLKILLMVLAVVMLVLAIIMAAILVVLVIKEDVIGLVLGKLGIRAPCHKKRD